MAAHQIGLAFVGVAAGLEVGVGPVEGELAVAGLVDVVDLQGQQAAFLVQEELGIVGGRLEDGLHHAQEGLGLVEFGRGQARPDAVQEFGDLLLRHHRTFIDEIMHQRGVEARLHGIEIVLVADPERHLAVEGDGRVLGGVVPVQAVAGRAIGADGQGRAPFALEQHVEAEAAVVEIGLELEGEGRALDAAGPVRILPEQIIFLAHGPEEPRGQAVGDLHAVAVIVQMLADLAGHMRQLGRELAPVGIVDDLLQGDLVMHAGEAGFVLPAPEKGDQQAPLFRLEAEDEVMLAGLRLHVGGEEGAEALPPVLGRDRDFFGVALFLAQFFQQAQGQGRHMAAGAGEGFRAVALVARAAVRNGKGQAGRVDLQVLALDDALRLPGLALLDIYFLHPAFGQDIVSRITDILRDGVVQEGLAHLPDDVLF